MKRTRNGILIPDVPIMAGGNLPNAVKGVSEWNDKPLDPLNVRCPFFIRNESADVAQIKICKRGDNSPSIEIDISQNAKDWETIGTTSINGLYVNILPNSRLYLRAEISSWSSSSSLLTSSNYINVNKTYSIGGNILSLLYGEKFNGQTEFKNDSANAFLGLFRNEGNLVDASSLQLNANIVPAGAYDTLFNYCSNLEFAPIIKGQTFGNGSCNIMFSACTKINRIECHATNPASGQFVNWVQGVALNGTFVKKRGVEWTTGISGIPDGWTVEEID